MFRQIAVAAVALSAVSCAATPPVVEQPSFETRRADLNGIYRYSATVTEQNVTRSSSHPTTRMINGMFRFEDGRLAELVNDYSTPCRVEDSGPAAPMRSMDPHFCMTS